jgi:adrenodoxin-NADP+ reductase
VGDLSELSWTNIAVVGPVTTPKLSINLSSRIFNDVALEIMSFLFRPYICSRCALQHSIIPQLSTSSRRNYSAKPAIHDGRQFRLAVIGSGPAGFYTAYKVMAKIENAKVDMYEHLPVPFGLVRFGVAPDHPEVKV